MVYVSDLRMWFRGLHKHSISIAYSTSYNAPPPPGQPASSQPAVGLGKRLGRQTRHTEGERKKEHFMSDSGTEAKPSFPPGPGGRINSSFTEGTKNQNRPKRQYRVIIYDIVIIIHH